MQRCHLDRDEHSNRSCLEAQRVDTDSAGRSWGYRGPRPVFAIRQVTQRPDRRPDLAEGIME
jgi:hypothetical protein